MMYHRMWLDIGFLIWLKRMVQLLEQELLASYEARYFITGF
jgi:hypothetical protein